MGLRNRNEKKGAAAVVGHELAAVSQGRRKALETILQCGNAHHHDSGSPILQVLPDDSRPWYRTPHLIKLNLLLLVPLVSSGAIGYDGRSPWSLE